MSTGPGWDPDADDLPAPEDDGACDHLVDREIPAVALKSTAGGLIDLRALPGRTVVYCFPRAGQPGVPLPDGWDLIPGARGCTPENLAFREKYEELKALRAEVFGLSAQTPEEQAEIAMRLDMPFPLLSDADLAFARGLDLPFLECDGLTLIRRLTLVIADGLVEHVFYPIFPPDRAAEEVIVWLLAHPRRPMF